VIPGCSPKYIVFWEASFSCCSLRPASFSSISLRFAAFFSSRLSSGAASDMGGADVACVLGVLARRCRLVYVTTVERGIRVACTNPRAEELRREGLLEGSVYAGTRCSAERILFLSFSRYDGSLAY
jgi:hypothetical protein